jgi:flavin reductase (DIM6/NTAB) family NADH-FMN oxidoreductase RutF
MIIMIVEPEKAYQLLSPRLVLLITTLNSKGAINAAPVSFASPISFSPAIVMISLRPIRHTYRNILETKEFVLNILGKEYLDQVLRCAARYQEGVNKLQQAGLKWYSSKIVNPPRVKEAKAWIECKFLEERKFGDHMAVLGEVLTAEVKDEVVKEGEVDLTKILPIMHLSKDMFVTDFKVVRHKRYD